MYAVPHRLIAWSSLATLPALQVFGHVIPSAIHGALNKEGPSERIPVIWVMGSGILGSMLKWAPQSCLC